jgi:hypothetical protein
MLRVSPWNMADLIKRNTVDFPVGIIFSGMT